MFTVLILIVHVVVCVALILIILLQSGKGADIGAVFGGGGGGTVFGPTGAATVMSKITIGAAVVFMVTSIVLSYFSAGRLPAGDKSVVGGQSETQVPSQGSLPVPTSQGTVPSGPKEEVPITAPAPGPSVPQAAPQTGAEKPAAPSTPPPVPTDQK
jgi:preprotein translocase subunit SecG